MLRILIGWLIIVLMGTLFGCSQGDYAPGQIRDTIALLKEIDATGQISFSFGGSPIQAGMKQTWFLGSENVVFTFSGKADMREDEP